MVSLGRPVVPDLSGLTELEAQAALTPVLLTVDSVDFQYSDAVSIGLVLGQSPAAGTAVPIGSSVGLVISLGRPVVPEVVGSSVPEATAAHFRLRQRVPAATGPRALILPSLR